MNALERLARLGIRAPRRIIAPALFVMLTTAVLGMPITNSLSAGGFRGPTAESTRAMNVLATKFGQGDTQLLITVSCNDGRKQWRTMSVPTRWAALLCNRAFARAATRKAHRMERVSYGPATWAPTLTVSSTSWAASRI